MEPDKCEGWAWVPHDRVPTPVFLPLQKLLDGGYRPAPAPAPAS